VPEVSWLTVAPVKGLALQPRAQVQLERHGVTDNRRFHLVDADGRRFAVRDHGVLLQVGADYDSATSRLTLTFPDGAVIEGEITLGVAVVSDFWGRPVAGRVVEGPWGPALSEFVGGAVRVVQSDEPGAGVDRGRGKVSLVSDASLEELARQGSRNGAVDGRRFRMLIGLAGCEPHEEDSWLGREVSVGAAVVRLLGTVGRCAVTTRNPDTGRRDFDALGAIMAYRGRNPLTKELDFGVFGDVVEPGPVQVGDPVVPR
jgi:uncharacterized protein YcbX